MTTRRICFLTTNDFGFGGSEDLWIGTAKWLIRQGHDVSASVRRWDPCPDLLQSLASEGCRVLWRDFPPSERDVASVVQQRADLVVVAQGYQLEGLKWLRRLVAERIPFGITNNCVHELGWPGLDEPRLQEFTRLQVLLYTLVLTASTLLPFAYGMSGWIYLAGALVLDGMFLYYAVKIYTAYSDRLAQQTFRFSVVYLAGLFTALLLDHYV